MDSDATAGERLAALLAELNVERAHFAAGGGAVSEVASLLSVSPNSVASLTAILPAARVPVPDALPLVVVTGATSNPGVAAAQASLIAREQSEEVQLPFDYEAEQWADVAADHGDRLVSGLQRLAQLNPLATSLAAPPTSGETAGVRYRTQGSGPALVLLSMGISPSQWDPVVDKLATTFTIIRVGGRNLGFIKTMEDRAAMAGYRRMVNELLDTLRVRDGDSVAEIGACSGALCRLLAERQPAPGDLIVVDHNPFFLEEGAYIAESEPHVNSLTFKEGAAEDLPLESESLDAVFSVTLLEECDADKAIGEMHRVLKPGGRAGVIVRSVDLPFFWSLDLAPELATRVNIPVGAVGARGCADRTLYARFARHFTDLTPFVHWASFAPPMDFHVGMVSAQLSDADRSQFHEAIDRDTQRGTAFAAQPYHCIAGVKRD